MIPRLIGQTAGWKDTQVGVPYNIPPTAYDSKNPFSQACSEGGICGALGLLDQGLQKESDMVQACAVEVF